jgi:hypothetical protein
MCLGLACRVHGHPRRHRAPRGCCPGSLAACACRTGYWSGYCTDPYDLRGEPLIDRELSQRLSPMKHIHHARTPTLLLQGSEDERCPKCQAEELFATIVCSTGTPAELVMYPGGSHHEFEQGRPAWRLDAVRRIVAWLQRWIDTPVKDDAAGTSGTRRHGEPAARAARTRHCRAFSPPRLP